MDEHIGPWRVERVLGSGGMGDVYLCTDGARQAAVKRLRNPTPTLAVRFAREVDLLRRIDHPGIAAYISHGDADRQPWLATRFVDGPDLRQYSERVRGRPPGERASRARAIAAALAETLGWLHGHGIVHRDVKPSNVILTAWGAPILIDFGVAALSVSGSADEAPTAMGVLVGTAAWAAPEQLRGSAIDARVDQYGLGCTIYFLLTGQRPFAAQTTAGLVRAHLEEAPRPPSLLDPTIPADMESVVLRMLAKEPGSRFATMADARTAMASEKRVDVPLAGRQPAIDAVAEAIRDVAEGRPVIVHVDGPQGSGRGWIARMARGAAERRGLACVIADAAVDLSEAMDRVQAGEPLLVLTSRPVAGARTIPLPPLSLADLRRSVFSFAPRTADLASVAERLHRESGGLAGLFLQILSRYRTDAAVVLPVGPLAADVTPWLDGLDLDALTVGAALAVLTTPASEGALSAIAQVPAELVLDALASRALAVPSEAGWRLGAEAFRGPLQNAIPDLDALRERAEAVLPAAPDPATFRRVQARVVTAEEAHARGDVGATRAAWEEAVDATAGFPHWNAELRIGLARSRLGVGDLPGALADARRAVVGVEGSFDPERRCAVLAGSAEVHLALGFWARAALDAADSAALAKAHELPDARFEAAVLRARAVIDERPHHRTAAAAALDRIVDFIADVDRQPPLGQVSLRCTWAHISSVLGDHARVDRIVRDVDDRMPRIDPPDRVWVWLRIGRALWAGGRATDARARADAAATVAGRLGMPLASWEAARLEARACGEPLPSLGRLADGLTAEEIRALEIHA